MVLPLPEKPSQRSLWARAFEAVVVCAVLAVETVLLLREPGTLRLELVPWATLIAAVNLLPVRVWRGVQIVMDFPLLLAIALLHQPGATGLVLLVGSFDPREFRREIGPVRAL